MTQPKNKTTIMFVGDNGAGSLSFKEISQLKPDLEKVIAQCPEKFSSRVIMVHTCEPDKVKKYSVTDQDRLSDVNNQSRLTSVSDKDRLTDVNSVSRLTAVADKNRIKDSETYEDYEKL